MFVVNSYNQVHNINEFSLQHPWHDTNSKPEVLPGDEYFDWYAPHGTKIARVRVFNFSCTLDPLVLVGLLLILKKTLRVLIVHYVCNFIKMSYKITFKFLHLNNMLLLLN